MQRFSKSCSEHKRSLDMRMAEERKAGPRLDQRLQRLFYGNYILIFIAGRTVHELNTVKARNCDWPLRESSQPLHILASHLPPIPQCGEARNRIEALHIFKARNNLVMVAAHKSSAHLAHS